MPVPTPTLPEKSLPPRPGAGGFTLVELMITLTVLGIVVAFALPSLGDLVRDQRVKTATSDVFASLIYARSEAIKRANDVSVVPNNAADWAAGWRVTDNGGNNLKIQDAIASVSINGNPAAIVYRGNGRLNAVVSDFVLSSPDSNAITARCVRLDLSGRPNIKVDSNGDPADGCQ